MAYDPSRREVEQLKKDLGHMPSLQDMLSVKGKVALVTGGTSGLGFDIAVRFLEGGANLSFSCKLDSQGNRIMAPYYQQKLHGEKLGILELNPETGETVDRDITYLLPRLLEEGNLPYDVAYYRSGKAGYLSLSFGNSLYVMDQTGSLLFTVQGDSSDVKAKGVHFLPDGVTMAVSFDNGLLELYELPSGEKRASCDLGEYSISSGTPAITRWEWTVEGRLLCYSNYETFLLDVSGGDIQVVAVIPSCIAYDPYQNRYHVLDSYYGIGQLNRLSVEEMISRGQKLLGT